MTHAILVHSLEDGRILGTYRLASLDDASLNTPAGAAWMLLIGSVNPDLDYIAEGVLSSRPVLTAPDGGVAPLEIDLGDMPAGTVVTARNEADESIEITDFSEALTLNDPGQYSLAAAPPFPYVGFAADIIVTEA